MKRTDGDDVLLLVHDIHSPPSFAFVARPWHLASAVAVPPKFEGSFIEVTNTYLAGTHAPLALQVPPAGSGHTFP
jgi:hypothetical protein